MRRAFFFLMISCTYYFAAMYRYLPLMALCVTEVLMVFLSFFQPRLFRRRMCFSFLKKSDVSQAGTGVSGLIHVEYTGRFPAGRFVIQLEAGYVTDENTVLQKISGECGRRGKDLAFYVKAPECGILRIRAKSVRIYDYFSIFSTEKPLKEEMQIAVFPAEQALKIVLSAPEDNGNCSAGEWSQNRPGEVHHEIRQIREYRTGDAIRHIHWNLSARMDGLWLKEYEQETNPAAHLVLEPDGFMEAETETLSSFYIVLYALLEGLLRNTPAVYLYWLPDPGGRWETVEITDGIQSRKVLLRLYRIRARQADLSDRKENISQAPFRKKGVFRLDMGLAWYLDQTLIYRFSTRDPEQEIREKVFSF